MASTSLAVAQATGKANALTVVTAATTATTANGATWVSEVGEIYGTAQAVLTTLMGIQIAAGGGSNSPFKYEDGLTAVIELQAQTAVVATTVAADAAAALAAFAEV